MRRIAAASVAGSLAVAGIVVPLALLAGVGGQGSHPGPGPAATGTTAPATSGPSVTAPESPAPTGGAVPDVGVFRCAADGIQTDTVEFAVQPDGVHLRVENPGHSNQLVIHGLEPPLSRLPIDLFGGDGREFVTPFLEPGTYRAGCEMSRGESPVAPFGPGEWVIVHVVDPAGIWSAVDLPCSNTTERIILVKSGIGDREGVPALIRAAVIGIEDVDDLVAAGYPESQENIAYVVRRDSANVAVVRALGRETPSTEALDVTSCDGSGIGDGQGARDSG